MKEIYDWVPWFKELAEKIAEGGEQYLIDKAKMVAWRDDAKEQPLLRYGERNIDPLSFFYTLASLSAHSANRNRIYPSIDSVFGMTRQVATAPDDTFIFPTPTALNTLFRGGGKGNPSLLWTLFRSAVSGFESVKPDDFEGALRIKNVATSKLTQTLFLINPEEFLPIDKHTTALGCFTFSQPPARIRWDEYRQQIRAVKAALPECSLYEANMFAYLRSSNKMPVQENRCFQVSTNAYDDNTDRWDDFERNNYVYTGGPGIENKYPLGEPKTGDVILVRFGRMVGRGIGVVYRNDYREEFDESHRLHVLWLNKARASLPRQTPLLGFSSAVKTIGVFRQAGEYASTFKLLDQLGFLEKSPGESLPPDDRSSEVGPPLNRILYGPPGTGKTWSTTALALEIVDGAAENPDLDRRRFDDLRFDPSSGAGQIAMVTFHQNFAYEDFVEGIRPALNEAGNLTYELRPGIFKRIVDVATKRRDERFVLIIDEINRGNIAKIFGELITLIEDSRRIGRDDATHVALPYSGETFGVPDNVFIIATMNTADRSIQLLDTALRRRFTFIEAMPDPQHEGICRDLDGIDCTKMLKTMNDRIAVLFDREHQIGHTYLLGVDNIGELSKAFRNRIFPLLQEYFFDDWAKIRAVLGSSAFVKEKKVENLSMKSETAEEDQVIYERLPDGDQLWKEPDQYRAIYREDTGELEGA